MTENTSDTDHIFDRKVKLRKDMKVIFTPGNSEELKSATLISRSRKATGKYKNAWNSQLDDGAVTSINFNKDISSLEIVADSNGNIKEIHYSQIYIRKLEKQVFEAKTKELSSWKEQNVYLEEDSGQPCITVSWIVSRKVADGNNIAFQNWNISLIDVKTAFLLGRKIERIVYLFPPKEANTSKV